jgi:hypothetical protein
MKKTVIVSTVALLLIVGLALWLIRPPADEGWSRGHTVGFVNLPAGVTGDTLIQSFQKNGFEQIEESTFDEIVPGDSHSRSYVGSIALRDTTTEESYEFVLGIGSDVVFWFESHDGSSDSVKTWEEHLEKRVALVERLAFNKK